MGAFSWVLFEVRQQSWSLSSPAAEIPMEPPPPDRSQVLDHLGLVAGLVEALGMGEMMDHAP